MDWVHLAQNYGQVAGPCENVNEFSVSAKSEDFLD
jgi:hypothetical protein